MKDKQETSDFPMDLFDDSHIPSDDEEQIKLGEDGNSAATLPKNQNNQAAKQTVAKKGNKKDVPKFMHNGIKLYFRPADPATTDRRALFGSRRLPKPFPKSERRVVMAKRTGRAVFAKKKSKKGKRKQKKGGKRKKQGMDLLMGMMDKLHVGERAEVERRKRECKKKAGLVFPSKSSRKRMLQRLRDNNLEGGTEHLHPCAQPQAKPSSMSLRDLARMFPNITVERVDSTVIEYGENSPWAVLRRLEAISQGAA